MSMITAVNVRGEKVAIPAHWLNHPVLGKGFRLPRSAEPKPAAPERSVDDAPKRERRQRDTEG